jgi:hypothetical protein
MDVVQVRKRLRTEPAHTPHPSAVALVPAAGGVVGEVGPPVTHRIHGVSGTIADDVHRVPRSVADDIGGATEQAADTPGE